MADDTNSSFPSTRRDGPGREGPGRGSRPPGGRDSGGFRIRLSDNEMQAARALQDAFGLRSTVAVLGFSLRTLAQQLERGQLDELVSQHRAQAGSRPPAGRGSERQRERGDDRAHDRGGRGARIDPFARPARPAPTPAETIEPSEPSEPAESMEPAEPVTAEGEPAGEGDAAAQTPPDAESGPTDGGDEREGAA